jgi:hypothetical protein
LISYKAKQNTFEIIDMPIRKYLMVDGHGDPNTSQEFKDAIATLFSIAYKIKFASKLDLGKDYGVMPLEGLWSAKDMSTFTTARDKSQWDFTLMIMQPDWITEDMFKAAVEKIAQKDALVSLHKVRLETLNEGSCVQTLHVGSFDDEADTLEALHHGYVPNNGLKNNWKAS